MAYYCSMRSGAPGIGLLARARGETPLTAEDASNHTNLRKTIFCQPWKMEPIKRNMVKSEKVVGAFCKRGQVVEPRMPRCMGSAS